MKAWPAVLALRLWPGLTDFMRSDCGLSLSLSLSLCSFLFYQNSNDLAKKVHISLCGSGHLFVSPWVRESVGPQIREWVCGVVGGST